MSDQVQVTENETTTLTPQAGDEFDAQRAKALIDKLRPYEKQAKQLERELAALRQADEERKLAEMSQLERLQAELTRATEARQKLEADYAKQVRTNAVIAAAAKAGLYDPSDAVALLADVDTDGLDDALTKLKSTKPYLFKSSTPVMNPTNPAGGAGSESDATRLKRIYGVPDKSNIFGGPGGGVVWPTSTE